MAGITRSPSSTARTSWTWLDDSGATNATKPTPVWQVTKPPGITLRLFRTTWTNPRPDLEIKTLDFISAMSKAGPFLVALTAEP